MLQLLMTEHSERASVYDTDDDRGYAALELQGKHERVSHKRDEYVRKGIDLNVIQVSLSYAKT